MTRPDTATKRQSDIVIRLRPCTGCDAVLGVRRLLKYALRTCGLRAVEVRPADADTQNAATDKASTGHQR